LRLDSIDWQIIKFLIADARIPYSEIARRLNTSVPTVSERVQKLVKNQIIDLTAIVNYQKLGWYFGDIGITIRLGVKPVAVEQTARELLRYPRIDSIWITGGVHGMVIRVVEKSYQDLLTFIDEHLRPRPEFAQLDPQIILKEPLRNQKVPYTQSLEDVKLIEIL
jgi:Lrp/AsnC family transcriptional regulator for asnA, asnC and gidA